AGATTTAKRSPQRAWGGGERWWYGPTPKGPTPAAVPHGAPVPCVVGSRRYVLGSPTSVAPATSPKASSTSCTKPVMRRLEPLTMSPYASSFMLSASMAPGRKVTNGGTTADNAFTARPRFSAYTTTAD